MKQIMSWKHVLMAIVANMTLCTIVSSEHIPIQIEKHAPGAPITLGIPFGQGALWSPDHVRLLDMHGMEVQCQVTEVSSWEPVDYSIKWIWVFFFAGEGDQYTLEYGNEVGRKPITGPTIVFKNSQRPRGYADIDTGPLRFRVRRGETGFLEAVRFDPESDGFEAGDTIATGEPGRGSFLDLLDDNGIDSSRAVVTRTVREKGSGPLHAILRVEGTYLYSGEDNNPSPFVMRIHAYAGKSYLRVLHTMTYTGVPDKHEPVDGQHPYIAISDDENLIETRESDDIGWTQPNDQIAGVGLSLNYHFSENIRYQTAYYDGTWYDSGNQHVIGDDIQGRHHISLLQTGPKPNRVPPLPNSTPDERITGFAGSVSIDDVSKKMFEKAAGWLDISDQRWGIATGIRYFLEEYPKEISIDIASGQSTAYFWSPNAGPWSFERASLRWDAGMLDNFATGLTKTTEITYHFHDGDVPLNEVQRVMNYFLDPPAPHASPETYAQSKVYGQFSPRGNNYEEFERSLDYKFAWNIFNQHWEPWYGILDHGDQMQHYFRDDWFSWVNNEPSIDFMHWLQFMRTGDRQYYLHAEAMSRHTMDVDNIHWPAKRPYYGDTNPAIDFWRHKTEGPEPTPFLGIGRRHARQHYTGLLSAHVWVPGWIASYYLTGYHRGLDVARMTGDTYIKRIWGDHDLRGRRLYLSVWNLVELWDATKDKRYFNEAQSRINEMLRLQNGPDQYGSLVLDRYGYSQVYISHGLYKYYKLTGDERVRNALVRHARAICDNPSWNHDYESFFSTIHSLLVGYELCRDEGLLKTAIARAEEIKTGELTISFEDLGTQAKIAKALLGVSNLPMSPRSGRHANWEITQSMRVFGWTHMYNVPWLLHWLRERDQTEGPLVKKKRP